MSFWSSLPDLPLIQPLIHFQSGATEEQTHDFTESNAGSGFQVFTEDQVAQEALTVPDRAEATVRLTYDRCQQGSRWQQIQALTQEQGENTTASRKILKSSAVMCLEHYSYPLPG